MMWGLGTSSVSLLAGHVTICSGTCMHVRMQSVSTPVARTLRLLTGVCAAVSCVVMPAQVVVFLKNLFAWGNFSH